MDYPPTPKEDLDARETATRAALEELNASDRNTRTTLEKAIAAATALGVRFDDPGRTEPEATRADRDSSSRRSKPKINLRNIFSRREPDPSSEEVSTGDGKKIPPEPERGPVIPKTAEEMANDEARRSYFELLNSPPKKNPHQGAYFDSIYLEYEAKLKKVEENYRLTKNKVVENLLVKGETGKAEAREFLVSEFEAKRENHFKNLSFIPGKGGMEKAKIVGEKGLEWWDKLGTEEGWKGTLQRFSKTAVSLAMIGALSGLTAEGVAKMGIGSASAIGSGVFSYMGKRMTMGLGLSAVMAKIPEKNRKWIKLALIAGSVGVVSLSGGSALAVGGIVASSAVGWGLGQLVKKYDKGSNKLDAGTENVSQLNFDTLEKDISTIETEIEREFEKTKKDRMWKFARRGAVAIGGSIVALEMMGMSHDSHTAKTEHTTDTKQHDADVKQLKVDQEALKNTQSQHNLDIQKQHELEAKIHELENKTSGDTKATDTTAPQDTHAQPDAEKFSHNPPGETSNPDHPATGDVSHPGAHTATETPAHKVANENISTAHKGDSFESVARRDIEHNPELAKELAKHFGFKGDLNDPKILHHFSGEAAHKIAIEKGFYADGKSAIIHEGEAIEIKDHENIFFGKPGADGHAPTLTGKYDGPMAHYAEHGNSPHAPETPIHKIVSETRSEVKMENDATVQAKNLVLEKMATNPTQPPPETTSGYSPLPGIDQQQHVAYVSTEHAHNLPGFTPEQVMSAPQYQLDYLHDHKDVVGNNPLHLSVEQNVKIVYEYRDLTAKFSSGQENVWAKIHNLGLNKIQKDVHYTNDPNHNQVWRYMQKLEQIGIKPKPTTWLSFKHETADEYLKRALQETAKRGISLPQFDQK